MQAAQVVQAQSELGESAFVASITGRLKSFRVRASRWRSRMMSRGERVFPTALAGQAPVQRPHSVQESKSSRSFQVKPESELTPSGVSGWSKLSVLRAAPRGVSGAV